MISRDYTRHFVLHLSIRILVLPHLTLLRGSRTLPILWHWLQTPIRQLHLSPLDETPPLESRGRFKNDAIELMTDQSPLLSRVFGVLQVWTTLLVSNSGVDFLLGTNPNRPSTTSAKTRLVSHLHIPSDFLRAVHFRASMSTLHMFPLVVSVLQG